MRRAGRSGCAWPGAGITDAQVERAIDEARILRRHVMRWTWQLVVPRICAGLTHGDEILLKFVAVFDSLQDVKGFALRYKKAMRGASESAAATFGRTT